jgi:two-component system, NtrC family, sensor kinase
VSARDSGLKRLVNSLLASHYLLPISSIVLFLVLGAAVYTVYMDTRFMRNQINEGFNQQQLLLARQAASQIGGALHDIRTEVGRLAEQLNGAKSREEERAFVSSAVEFVRPKGLLQFLLVDHGGAAWALPRYERIEDTAPNLWNPGQDIGSGNACDGLTLERFVLEKSFDGEEFVTCFICTPFSSPNFRNGTLYARIDVTGLVRVATENIRSGQTGYAWVIDQDGMFLYHPEREFIGKNAFTARQEREPYISFNDINEIMRGQMLKGEEGSGSYISGWHRGIQGEMTKLLAFGPVVSRGLPDNRLWSVAVSAPVAEVGAALGEVGTRHLLIEIAVVASMLGFAFLVTVYQRRASVALKEKVSRQEGYLTAILQDTVDAIIFIDNNNRIKVWNRGAEMLFGWTAEEMLDSRFRRLIPPELGVDEELERIRKEVYAKGHVRHYQTQRMTKSGKRLTVNLSRTLIRGEDGEPLGSAAIVQDMTEKLEMDKHIYHTEKLASIGVLAAGVAHEINNPLAIILGFSDLLKERFKADSSEYEDLKTIEENANHAKMIVENLLGFARVSEGLEDVVYVNGALDTVLTIVQNTLMTRKIDMVAEIPPDLPPVRGDAREFQQVIFNLINNSTAAMSENGGTLTISAEAEADWVHIRVADTGNGIPEDIKAHIFDPFFTTKKVGQGTGLGLSLCYGIVQKYGGRISFTSVSKDDHPDQPSGTTFKVSMPVEREDGTAKGDDF